MEGIRGDSREEMELEFSLKGLVRFFFRRTQHHNDVELSERIDDLFEEEYRDWHPAQGAELWRKTYREKNVTACSPVPQASGCS